MTAAESKASTAKIALWYIFASLFVKGLSVISTPIFTRILTKEEFGFISNFTSWETILLVLVTLDFSASIMRAKYDFTERMDEYMSTILLGSNFVTLIALSIIEINRDFFSSLFCMDISYIRLMFLAMFFLPAFNYLQIKHRIYQKYKFFVGFSILSATLSVVTSVILVLTLQNKLIGRLYGLIIPSVILNIILWLYIIKKNHRVSIDCLKFACLISIPLIPHTLSGILLGNSDRIMIMKYCGASDTAIYSLAYSVSLLANLIWNSMNQAWSPWLFDNIHAGNKNNIIKKSKMYLGIFSILVLGVFLISPEVVKILGGEKYMEAIFVMPPVILGCVFQFIYTMYVNIEIYSKKTLTIFIGTLMSALLNIGLNYVFIPKYGYIAAAYTTAVCYATLLVFHYFIVKKYIYNLLDIYNNRLIFFTCIGMTLWAIATNYIYKNVLVRHSMIILYLISFSVFAFKNKKQIMSLFRNKKK